MNRCLLEVIGRKLHTGEQGAHQVSVRTGFARRAGIVSYRGVTSLRTRRIAVSEPAIVNLRRARVGPEHAIGRASGRSSSGRRYRRSSCNLDPLDGTPQISGHGYPVLCRHRSAAMLREGGETLIQQGH